MISSIFLDISLLFSCCCFSFLVSFFFHFRSSDRFSSSAVFFVLFLHILPHSISTQFSSFISFAWFRFIITMITMLFPSSSSFSSSVSSSISAYSFFFPPLFSPLFLFFLFSFFFLPLLFFFISQCDDFLNFPCHFLGAVLPAPALYPSLEQYAKNLFNCCNFTCFNLLNLRRKYYVYLVL